MMKTLHICTLFITVSSSMPYCQEKSKKELRKEAMEKDFLLTKEVLESKHFAFTGEWMFASNGRRIDLATRPNSLKIMNDAAEANLAFAGEMRVPGSSNADISFNSEMEDFNIKENSKKFKFIVSFKVRGNDDSYSVTMNVASNGFTDLSITSGKRSLIRYTGPITKLD